MKEMKELLQKLRAFKIYIKEIMDDDKLSDEKKIELIDFYSKLILSL